jgi:hypothetical protein
MSTEKNPLEELSELIKGKKILRIERVTQDDQNGQKREVIGITFMDGAEVACIPYGMFDDFGCKVQYKPARDEQKILEHMEAQLEEAKKDKKNAKYVPAMEEAIKKQKEQVAKQEAANVP